MRTCQFCGAPVEFVEPAAAESEPMESSGDPPAPEQLPSDPKPDAGSSSAQQEAHPQNEPKRRILTCAAQAALALIAGVFILFLGYRFLVTLSNMNHAGPPSAAGAPQGANAGSSPDALSASELGVDVYPGARPLSEPDRTGTQDQTIVSQSFVSSDKMDLVINFYKARMTGYTSIYASGDGVVVSISPSGQESILVAISPAPAPAKTRISITHTTTKSAN